MMAQYYKPPSSSLVKCHPTIIENFLSKYDDDNNNINSIKNERISSSSKQNKKEINDKSLDMMGEKRRKRVSSPNCINGTTTIKKPQMDHHHQYHSQCDQSSSSPNLLPLDSIFIKRSHSLPDLMGKDTTVITTSKTTTTTTTSTNTTCYNNHNKLLSSSSSMLHPAAGVVDTIISSQYHNQEQQQQQHHVDEAYDLLDVSSSWSSDDDDDDNDDGFELASYEESWSVSVACALTVRGEATKTTTALPSPSSQSCCPTINNNDVITRKNSNVTTRKMDSITNNIINPFRFDSPSSIRHRLIMRYHKQRKMKQRLWIIKGIIIITVYFMIDKYNHDNNNNNNNDTTKTTSSLNNGTTTTTDSPMGVNGSIQCLFVLWILIKIEQWLQRNYNNNNNNNTKQRRFNYDTDNTTTTENDYNYYYHDRFHIVQGIVYSIYYILKGILYCIQSSHDTIKQYIIQPLEIQIKYWSIRRYEEHERRILELEQKALSESQHRLRQFSLIKEKKNSN